MSEHVEFSAEELKVIGRLAQNLLSSALEAGLDAEILADIYYKMVEYV
jgi:hypothetical protein